MALIPVNIRKIFLTTIRRTILVGAVALASCAYLRSGIDQNSLSSSVPRIPSFRLWVPGEATVGDLPAGPGVLSSFLLDDLNRPVMESDLLHWHGQPILDLVGKCHRLDGLAATPVARVARIEADLPRPEQAARRVFFILPQQGTEIVGFGILDDQGRAVCPLLSEKDVLSTSSGEARVETAVVFPQSALGNSEPVFKLRVRRTGRVLLTPQLRQNFYPGDMLRIGRKPLPDGSLLFSDAPIARVLGGDIFRRVAGAGDNLGVSEYLATTLFLGNQTLQLELDEGIYRFAVLHSGHGGNCISEVEVRYGSLVDLSCGERTMVGVDSPALQLDATFPEGSLRGAWESSEILRSRGVSLLKKLDTDLGSYSGLVLDAEGTRDPEGFCRNAIASFRKSNLLLAGTGERLWGLGATPFVTMAESLAPIETLAQLQNSFYFVSNGAQVDFVGASSSLLWPVPPQQKIRTTIRIPSGNDTGVLAFFVNGKELRRMSIPRSSWLESSRFVFDESLPRREDYDFSLCAWGNIPLPEFITGTSGVLPLLVSRPVCIDADGDGRCQIHNEGD
jgi:hypothetical protein